MKPPSDDRIMQMISEGQMPMDIARRYNLEYRRVRKIYKRLWSTSPKGLTRQRDAKKRWNEKHHEHKVAYLFEWRAWRGIGGGRRHEWGWNKPSECQPLGLAERT